MEILESTTCPISQSVPRKKNKVPYHLNKSVKRLLPQRSSSSIFSRNGYKGGAVTYLSFYYGSLSLLCPLSLVKHTVEPMGCRRSSKERYLPGDEGLQYASPPTLHSLSQCVRGRGGAVMNGTAEDSITIPQFPPCRWPHSPTYWPLMNEGCAAP